MNKHGLAFFAHAAAGCILLASHALYFFRALAMRRRGSGPKTVDRIARSISHWGLPVAVASGLAVAGRSDGFPGTLIRIIHILLGLSPLLAIMIFTVMRPLKVRIPWLLPLINLVLFFLALLSGLAA